MYYKLSQEQELCGYRGLPFTAYDKNRDIIDFFNREQFKVILMCDGQHNINEDLLSSKEKDYLKHLVDINFVVPCEKEDNLEEHQKYRFFDNYIKQEVQWSITGDCNYRCRHCFMSAPDAKFGIPSTEQLLYLVKQFAKCGIHSAHLTGGEPLIRQDLFQIIDALLTENINISVIYSNGHLVTDKLLDELVKRNIKPQFHLSFDGINGMHDWLRGVEGAEKDVIRAMDLLKSRGFPISASMALHKLNIHQIRESVLKLSKHGCKALKLATMSTEGCWLKNEEFSLTEDEYFQAVLDYIPQYLEDGIPLSLMVENFFNYNVGDLKAVISQEKRNIEKASVCGAMRRGMYVSPEGKVLPCMSIIGLPIAQTYPNAFETPLRDIINNSAYCSDMRTNLTDFFIHNKECRECKYSKLCCGGCRAKALEKGSMDFLIPEKTICYFYKNGWYDKFNTAVESFNQKIADKNQKGEF